MTTTELQAAFGVKTMTVIDLNATDDSSTAAVICSYEPAEFLAKYHASVQRWLSSTYDSFVRVLTDLPDPPDLPAFQAFLVVPSRPS